MGKRYSVIEDEMGDAYRIYDSKYCSVASASYANKVTADNRCFELNELDKEGFTWLHTSLTWRAIV